MKYMLFVLVCASMCLVAADDVPFLQEISYRSVFAGNTLRQVSPLWEKLPFGGPTDAVAAKYMTTGILTKLTRVYFKLIY